MARMSALAWLCAALACLYFAQSAEVQADEASPGVAETVDNAMEKAWRRDGITPARPSSASEFLRRVYFDTTGAPPTREEAEAFLNDESEDRREKLIDKLTADPRFGRYMADIWAAVILNRGQGQLNPSDLMAAWLAKRINQGAGFDAIIREIITARGNLADSPAVAVFFNGGEQKDLRDVAGQLTKALSGVQIQCAQCHKHPYEKWTTDDFNGMTSFFITVEARSNNDFRPALTTVADKPDRVKRIQDAIKVRDKLSKEQKAQLDLYAPYVKPKFLGGEAPSADPMKWREALAKWFTAQDNPQTPRYVVNRIFAIAFGRGLHEPVDDFNSFNSPSHPELLEDLTRDFVASGWDIRRLYRGLLKSRAWQLSSMRADKKAQPAHFASYPVRPMGPEQFIASVVALADQSELTQAIRDTRYKVFEDYRAEAARYEKAKKEGKLPANEKKYIYDTESLAKYEQWVNSMPDDWLLRRTAAARYARLSSDDEMGESEGFTVSIVQALAVMNGAFTNKVSLVSEKSLLGKIFEEFAEPKERVTALYRAVLCREPSESEMSRALDCIKSPGREHRHYEDLMFALMMTTEFATNH